MRTALPVCSIGLNESVLYIFVFFLLSKCLELSQQKMSITELNMDDL